MTWVGIDPGMDGGVGFVWYADFQGCHAQPLPFNGKEFDAKEFRRSLIGKYREEEGVFCIVERAQVMPRQGAVSGFTIGKNYGQILGVLSTLEIPYETVPPRTWQKAIFGAKPDDTKAASVACCKRLFPTIDLLPGKRRKEHDGMSDALLIAEYARRLRGNP